MLKNAFQDAFKTTGRDWIEDFPHENGRYECACIDCGKTFYGHKRRVVCKACTEAVSARTLR